MTLLEEYERLRATPGDIQAHLPALRWLAGMCNRVLELGVRGGVSTTALLTGLLDNAAILARDGGCLVLVDIVPRPEVYRRLAAWCGPVALNYAWESSLTHTPPGPQYFDMTFIDTLHTGPQLYAELTRYAPYTRRWLALHDTVTFGDRGEGGGPGLVGAVTRFLDEHPEWAGYYHDTRDNGFTVLARGLMPATPVCDWPARFASAPACGAG